MAVTESNLRSLEDLFMRVLRARDAKIAKLETRLQVLEKATKENNKEIEKRFKVLLR